MKKKLLFSALVVLITPILFFVIATHSEDYGPTKITIDTVTKATSRYIGVDFKHRFHSDTLDIECTTCHHTEKEDFTGTPLRCESCHNADTAIDARAAFHKRCIVCHLDSIKAGKNPPTECLRCHKERK